MSGPDQSAELKLVVTNTLIVADIQRSVAFYRDVLGATVLREGEPTFLRLGNIWLTINEGGGPTDDKPEVVEAVARHYAIGLTPALAALVRPEDPSDPIARAKRDGSLYGND